MRSPSSAIGATSSIPVGAAIQSMLMPRSCSTRSLTPTSITTISPPNGWRCSCRGRRVREPIVGKRQQVVGEEKVRMVAIVDCAATHADDLLARDSQNVGVLQCGELSRHEVEAEHRGDRHIQISGKLVMLIYDLLVVDERRDASVHGVVDLVLRRLT